MNKFLLLPALASTLVLTACFEEDRPPAKGDHLAEFWTDTVKTSYSDFQPPAGEVAPNPYYVAPVPNTVEETATDVYVMQVPPDDGNEAMVPIPKLPDTPSIKETEVAPLSKKQEQSVLDQLFDYESATEYEVVSGDTLSKIARKQYGNGNYYPALIKANKDTIKDSSKICVGQKIRVPQMKAQKVKAEAPKAKAVKEAAAPVDAPVAKEAAVPVDAPVAKEAAVPVDAPVAKEAAAPVDAPVPVD